MMPFKTNPFQWAAYMLLNLLVIGFSACKDKDDLSKCEQPNACVRGYSCIDEECACPEDRVDYYDFCVKVSDFPLVFMTHSGEGDGCSDSLLWALSDKKDFVGTEGYFTQRIYTPVFQDDEYTREMLFYQTRFLIRGYPTNPDSFFLPYYEVIYHPIDAGLLEPIDEYAYASGIFTSDSTGFMHLDWHRFGDSLPYRRCTMPFTRIK